VLFCLWFQVVEQVLMMLVGCDGGALKGLKLG